MQAKTHAKANTTAKANGACKKAKAETQVEERA